MSLMYHSLGHPSFPWINLLEERILKTKSKITYHLNFQEIITITMLFKSLQMGMPIVRIMWINCSLLILSKSVMRPLNYSTNFNLKKPKTNRSSQILRNNWIFSLLVE